MTRPYDWDVYGEESPTQIHHQDCQDTPDSYRTGDANAVAVRDPDTYAEDGETFDVSCTCLDPLLGGGCRAVGGVAVGGGGVGHELHDKLDIVEVDFA